MYIIQEIGQHERHVLSIALVCGCLLLVASSSLSGGMSLNCPEPLFLPPPTAKVAQELDKLSLETQKYLLNNDLTQSKRRARLQKLCRITL